MRWGIACAIEGSLDQCCVSWRKNHFLLFPFPCFYSYVFCQGDVMAEDKTRHQKKRVKAVVGMVTKIWQGGLLLACFWAWPKFWVDGPESTKENASTDYFWQGLAATVCFLWFTDLWHPPVKACHHVLMSSLSLSIFTLLMFTLLPQQVAKGYWKDCEAERGGLNGLCRRSKEKRGKKKQKFVERQLNDLEEETSKLADEATAALNNHKEQHMRDHHDRLKLMSNTAWAKNLWKECTRWLGRSGCSLAMFWSGNGFTERRWRVDKKNMMKCGIDGRARVEKRTRKEAKWKLRTRQDRSLRSRVVQFANGTAQGGPRTCRSAKNSLHCRVWWKDKFTQFSV